MSYATQFQKVKRVLSSIATGDLNRVLVQGGRIYATDDRMVVSTEFDTDLEFFVDGATFGAALQARNVVLSMDDQTLVVRSDKDTNRLASSELKTFQRPTGKWRDVPPIMLTAFKTLSPFQGEDRTREWSCAVTMRDGLTFATNNRIFGVWEGGAEDISVSFPNWLVDYVLGLEADLTGFIVEDLWIGFRFSDGTDVRSARLGRDMLDEAVEMGKAIEPTGAELPKGWSAAVQYVSELPGCDTLTIGPDRMYAETENGSRERKIESPTTKETMWDPAWINRVASAATHIDLEAWPNPSTWNGPRVKGLLLGKVVQ